jgi:hypothetical protein
MKPIKPENNRTSQTMPNAMMATLHLYLRYTDPKAEANARERTWDPPEIIRNMTTSHVTCLLEEKH